jgi:site-specific DNA-methyltransferase (adenine-specific)
LAKPLDLGGTAELIWDKEHLGPGNLEVPWGPEHERFTFGVYDWSAVKREKGGGRLSARLRQGSVIRARRPNSGQVRHPDEKPVPLLRPLVEASSLLGETVFDPTCGVGSVGVAAVLAGRQFVGIECDLRYADIAVDRLKAAERLAELADAA